MSEDQETAVQTLLKKGIPVAFVDPECPDLMSIQLPSGEVVRQSRESALSYYKSLQNGAANPNPVAATPSM